MGAEVSAATRKEYEEVLRASAEVSAAPCNELSPPARKELENVLLLLVSDLRRYRDSEQKKLSDTELTVVELFRIMGGVAALKNVLQVIDMLADLYKLEL